MKKSIETIDKVLEDFSARVYKNRKSHMLVKDVNMEEGSQQIQANTRTIPGIITTRGCCFAGCKGVVLGPIKDMVHIVHGPIGCAFYTWGTRRNKARPEDGGKNFLPYCFSTDMQESDIVFGGEKKLSRAIKEAVEIFKPAAITICSTCPVGLIGDDIHSIAAQAEKEYGIQVIAFSCEGYKGVSQSGGHHIANNGLMKNVIGRGDMPVKKYSVNILGEYNIGADGWEIERIMKKIGYHIVSVMTGDGSYENLKSAHKADVNLVHCHRSINYIAGMLETKYGTPWIKTNFFGISGTARSLRNLAAFFGDQELTKRTEEVIDEETAGIRDSIDYYYERLKGKSAFLFVGGSRAHHYQYLLDDLGIETILAGYEFAHRDDYEGRKVIPFIKEDADSKNIEEITVQKDERFYRVHLPSDRYEKLKKEIPLSDYDGMIKDMKDGSIVIDDMNHHETEKFIKYLKPDMFFSGIKDKYVVQKMGVLSRQLHSYDYQGPYAGFRGALNFARDMDMGVYTPGWKYITAPWKTRPILEGIVDGGGN